MPINHSVCLKYKDTWAAPNSDLYKALEEKNFELAEKLYQRGERVLKELEDRK